MATFRLHMKPLVTGVAISCLSSTQLKGPINTKLHLYLWCRYPMLVMHIAHFDDADNPFSRKNVTAW